jgi:hypothetical protein
VCGNERLPRREQGTGGTGTAGALNYFVTTQQESFLLETGRRQLFLKGY